MNPSSMNPAETKTCQLIEDTLFGNKAFSKVDEKLYVVKQGSSYVMINVLPWGDSRAIVRCVAQMVTGVEMNETLALELLQLNTVLRFGAFAYEAEGGIIFFLHSILGGETLDPEELLATVRDVALVSDEWDDRIIEHYGGKRMQDLLETEAMNRIMASDPDTYQWRSRSGDSGAN